MLDCAGKQDIPFLKQIWKECFGDSDRYINRYFDTLFDRITIAVKRSDDNIPVSMVSMLPVSLCTPDGNYPGHYIYAAATAKALAEKAQVEMPITEAAYQVLYQGKDPHAVIHELMTRDRKHELEDSWV